MDDPPKTHANDYSSGATYAVKLKSLLYYAALAPSIHNTQPWRFEVRNKSILLYADESRRLSIADPQARQLHISCGAALDHLSLAFRYHELEPLVELFPITKNVQCIAQISIQGTCPCSILEKSLFNAMKDRHTTRAPFLPQRIDSEIAEELTNIISMNINRFTGISDPELRNKVVKLVMQADRHLVDDENYQNELFSWIESNSYKLNDGMPLERLELPDMQTSTSSNSATIENTIMGLLSSQSDSTKDWVSTGQALSRMLLYAAVKGLSASFLNQPIDVPALRPQLANLVGIEGYPQMLILLGVPSTKHYSNRRVPSLL